MLQKTNMIAENRTTPLDQGIITVSNAGCSIMVPMPGQEKIPSVMMAPVKVPAI